MKSTGMVRKRDPLGRVVLPRGIRKTFDLKKDEPLEIFIDGNQLVLRKYTPGCILCGETQGVRTVHEKKICPQCLETLKTAT
jgi:AbrB family transcriptional regulator, transcriptional pleiotropic regulator of transition state genes